MSCCDTTAARGVWKLPAALLAVWLIAFAWLWFSGEYTAFLAVKLWPILVMAVVLLTLFLVGVLVHRKGGGASLTRRLLQAGVLLLPLAYMTFVVPPEGLGSHAFATRSLQIKSMVAASSSAPAPRADNPEMAAAPAPAAAPIEVNCLDLTSHFENYRDQLIATEGMVARPDQLQPGHFVVFRFVISCCVSDAMPAGLLVRYPDAAAFAPDTWVRLEGTLRVEPAKFGQTLIIEAAKVQAIPAPQNPYLNEGGPDQWW